MKNAISCAATVLFAMIVHVLAARFLAGRDVLEALLVAHQLLPLVMLISLLAARLFLFLLAPGWICFVVLKIVLERGKLRPPWITPRTTASPSSTSGGNTPT